VARTLKQSIQYALDHREEALNYAMQFARDLDPGLADKFIGMYVNERTLDYGDDGRAAVRRLLEMGYDAGIIPHQATVAFDRASTRPGERLTPNISCRLGFRMSASISNTGRWTKAVTAA